MRQAGKKNVTRMCIACRKVSQVAGLWRFIRQKDGVVALDALGVRQTRGAYTCKNSTCVSKAMEKKAFGRAFQKPVLLFKEAINSELAATIEGETFLEEQKQHGFRK